MKIKELIIDGFKSYATRTVINGFDDYFNAITGLNGSGKSNVLDAICFVLGISNLKEVRATRLQELIYKQGQAGVTKATVTVIFTNDKKEQSPIGYEDFKEIVVTRQIQIGGKGKYFINGHNATQNKVQTLFQTVQMNVNNPHFLVLQGRIAKMLEMKPKEILAILEETAGTKMFEERKEFALKTLTKKQLKVDDMEEILRGEITPTLEKLRDERASYIEYSDRKNEYERSNRLVTAYEFMQLEKSDAEFQSELAQLRSALDEKTEERANFQRRIAEHKQRMDQLKKETHDRREVQELERKATDVSKELVRVSTLGKNATEGISTLRRDLALAEEHSRETVKAIQDSERLLVECTSEEEELKASADASKSELQEAEDQYSNAVTGISGDSRSDFIAAQKRQQEIQGKMDQISLRKKRGLEILAQKEKELKKMSAADKKLVASLDAVNKEITALSGRLAEMEADRDGYVKASETLEELSSRQAILKDEYDTLSHSLARYGLKYDEAACKLPKGAVKGMVVRLFRVREEKWLLACQVAGGSKLFNVVVENENTAKTILTKGKLKARITLIPLNKIQSKSVSKTDKGKATRSTRGKASLALDAVTFDDELTPAMEYIFGRTFVCEDAEAAKKVAFGGVVKAKAITIDGDVYDPAGLLTGGSRKGDNLLSRFERFLQLEEELGRVEEELAVAKSKQKEYSSMEEYEEVSDELEMKTHTKEMLSVRLKHTKFAEDDEEKKELQNSLQGYEVEFVSLKKESADLEKKLKILQAQVEGDGADTAEVHRMLKMTLVKLKERDTICQGKYTAVKEKHQLLELEIEKLKVRDVELKQKFASLEGQIAELKVELEKHENLEEELKAKYAIINNSLMKERETELGASREIAELMKGISKMEEVRNSISMDIKKLGNSLETEEENSQHRQDRLATLLKKNNWIQTEKSFFGKKGSQYDFDKFDMKEVRGTLSDLRKKYEHLSRSVNMKVMSMFERAESEYQNLINKKETIMRDKSKIEDVISELNVKKLEAINTTYKKVNEKFGTLFSSLLKGYTCNLVPVNPKDLTEGLTINVTTTGGVVKESLSELSHGQKSLLTLSFILALLLCKPAPLYILDEIDSALDLSNSQHIGQILRDHFKDSQFIVVSLKEEMYKHANVIFQAQFVDGNSRVLRLEMRHK